MRVTLIDRNNYHQFQPLLYQVATSQLAPSDIAYSLRKLFARRRRTSTSSWPRSRRSTRRRARSRRPTASASPATPSSSRPARSRTSSARRAPTSTRSRSTRLDDASGCARASSASSRTPTATPSLIDEGALNFVVVGGGPTGVELAGALADLIHETMTVEYHDLAVTRGAGPHRRPRPHAARPVLRQRARLRRQGAGPQGRAAAPRASASGTSPPTTSVCRPRRTFSADFADPHSPAAKAHFSDYREVMRMPEIVRVKLYDRSQTVAWSDEPRLIGQRFAGNPQLTRAIAGETVAHLEIGKKAENVFEEPVRLVELYVPLTIPPAAGVTGIVETYKTPTRSSRTSIARAASSSARRWQAARCSGRPCSASCGVPGAASRPSTAPWSSAPASSRRPTRSCRRCRASSWTPDVSPPSGRSSPPSPTGSEIRSRTSVPPRRWRCWSVATERRRRPLI